MVRGFGFLLVISLILGCGADQTRHDRALGPLLEPRVSGSVDTQGPHHLAYRNIDEFDPAAQIFLVAGGMDVANFAQEVIDQRRHWLGLGFRPEQIACYYTRPLQPEFDEDRAQYLSLAEALADCYPASPELVWRHLNAASSQSLEFVYLYVTSHGVQPISQILRQPGIDFPTRNGLFKLLRELPVIDQYFITLDALSADVTANINERLVALAEGQDPAAHLFTPRYLRKAMEAFPASLPKFVTLQACYSGGFVREVRAGQEGDTLVGLENITVLTAARDDRPSFGCDPGGDTTYFGGVYNEVLAETPQRPLDIDWYRVFTEVNNKVTALEEELNNSLRDEGKAPQLPSTPQFYRSVNEP